MRTTKIEKILARTAGVSAVALMAGLSLSGAAFAQQATVSEAASIDEIVVTGSRIVREGYEAPTPVSVLGSEELSSMGLTNIADAVNRLPAVQGSVSPQNSEASFSSGTGGVNQLNLRNLRPLRTLVLLDGKRVVGATLSGFENNGSSVDVNVIPNDLVSRVDVVTGGASAAYGSDALAGVVNFVLDRTFTGVKGSIEGGITTYGDNEQYKVGLTAGTPFAGGRGHVLISGEHAYNTGIPHASDRPWYDGNSYNWLQNPAYGTGAGQSTGVPQYIAMGNTGIAISAPGGLVIAGPLKGTMFLQGGVPATFRYGEISDGFMMSGGDWRVSRIDNDPMLGIRLSRETVFTRASYDIADNIQVYGEFHWSNTRTTNKPGIPHFRLGNITVRSDNPFIPTSVRTQMTALGLTTLAMGSTSADLPPVQANNGRTFRRYMAGVEGAFDAAGSEWSWDAYYTKGTTHISARIPENLINSKFNEAVDAVVNPATGQIVCRSSLSNPTNGCVPYNPMGIGVNSPNNKAYFTGTGYSIQIIGQDVIAANVSGEPFESWAGPVSVAFGAEHRRESVKGLVSDADAKSQWFVGNFKATNGKYHVTEGYVEAVLPLARGQDWAQSFDLNAAARATDYSEAGFVTTWKVGATYTPIDDFTIRATRSRDIRAPNLSDLFNAGQPGTGTIIDRFRNNTNTTIVSAVEGNLDLIPEKADTTGLGIVLQPTFIPGFGASIDYYNINIKGAISSISTQEIMDRCFAGETALCAFIDRGAPGAGQTLGEVTYVHVKPANVLGQQARGIDFEVSQNVPLSLIDEEWGGALQFRALATKVSRLRTIDKDIVQEGRGVMGSVASGAPLTTPKFRYLTSATYAGEAFTGTLTMRGIGSGKYSNSAIVCTSGCPVSTVAAPTFSLNHIDAVKYFDLSLSYKIMDGAVETFFVAENMFNRAPPIIYGSTGAGFYSGWAGASGEYDRQGRVFHAGVRFRM
ncbi:MAG: TonB-dependent receptor [Rhodospirillaceae bacterium]